MKNSWSVRLAKKHGFGKFLCRIVGEEKGAVMMEYVIVALLIAAACVAAVAVFGKQIVNVFGVATEATIGNANEAAIAQEEAINKTESERTKAAQYHDDRHTADKWESKGEGQ